MWKNRAGYALAVAALAALVWLFGRPFLVCALVLAAGLPFVQLALLKRDAGAVSVSLSVRPGGREGEALLLCFEVENGRALHAARSVYLDLAMNNLLLGEETHRRVMLTLSDGANRFFCPIVPPCCGEIVISCRETGLCDLLHLFRERVAPFDEVRTVIYPRPVQLELTLSRDAVGETGDSGLTRSRKGTDASEMFDIRSYVPGDDIRSIHWKLSGKTDELIVRQASDRTHYDLVILPDFGRKQGGRGITAGELTRCVALVIELSRRLVRRGVPLCVALPGPGGGMELFGFKSVRELEQSIPRWLSIKIPEQAGRMMQLFRMEHLENRFTRMVTVSAGAPETGLRALANDIGVLSLTVTKDVSEPRAVLLNGVENIEIPAEGDAKINILC